jgi:hypothetical protein
MGQPIMETWMDDDDNCDDKPTKSSSVAWVHERSIPTERRPLVGEVSADFCGQRSVA